MDKTKPKRPAALKVVESASSSAGQDAEAYRSALARRAAARKADKWIDQCMEEQVSRELFERVLPYLHPPQYAELTQERHINSLCGYSLCGNPPAEPYRSNPRFVVSSRDRTITRTEGNDDKAFCSRRCAIKSAWVARSLGSEGAWLRSGGGSGGGAVGGGRVELIEELEEKGVVRWEKGGLVWGSAGQSKNSVVQAATASTELATPPVEPTTTARPRAATQPDSTELAAATNATLSTPSPPEAASKPVAAATEVIEPPASRPAPPPAPLALPTPPLPGNLASLAAALTIVERATPKRAPAPPSLDPQFPPEPGPVLAAPGVIPMPMPMPADLVDTGSGSGPGFSTGKQSARAARRGGAGLISASTGRIAGTVLAATGKLGNDEEESDESSEEEEWAKAMGWGQGAEVDELFEEARKAKALLAAGKELS